MAIRAMYELKKHNLNVPGDVAVTGFDFNELSRNVMPKLTTVCQPSYDLGITAFNTILSMIKKGKVPKKQILPTKLIIQLSCGCTKIIKSPAYNNVTEKVKKNALFSHEEKKLIIDVIVHEIETNESRICKSDKLIVNILANIKKESHLL